MRRLLDLHMLNHALSCAQAAAQCGDKVGFLVAVRVAQSYLRERLDLVRLLDASIKDFPHSKYLGAVRQAVAEREMLA